MGLSPPSLALPYTRLNMSIPKYLEYLKHDPFLSPHAKLLVGNSNANNETLHAYLKMTAKKPLIPELSEYEEMINFFGPIPTKIFGVSWM